MNKVHEKSPCCRGNIRRFGGRRRQCGVCGHTWSVWKKKRGRNCLRMKITPAENYLSHRVPALGKQHVRGLTEAQLRYRLSKSRRRILVKRRWPKIPSGPLIMVADGMVRRITRQWYTWYFMVVRLPHTNRAVILPPYYAKGTETVREWRRAFDSLPRQVLTRIVALVCDGHRGLVFEAKWRSWHLQRCHFHLLARIQGRRSRWPSSRHFEEGKRIYALVTEALKTRDQKRLDEILLILEEIGWTVSSPALRLVLSGFVSHIDDYRTYLRYPKLNLPITNNTVESLVGLVTELTSRARGFRTAKSLHEWICALIKMRRTITCNGKNQQK